MEVLGGTFQSVVVAMVVLHGSMSTLHPNFQPHNFYPCSSAPSQCRAPNCWSTSCSLENSKSNSGPPRGFEFAKNLQSRRLRIVCAEGSNYDGFDSVRGRGESKGGRKVEDSYRSAGGENSGEERFGRSNAGYESSSSSNGGRGKGSKEDESSSSSSSSAVALATHVDVITSVGNAYVKHLVKVRQTPSYRNAAGCVVVVGSVPLRYIRLSLYLSPLASNLRHLYRLAILKSEINLVLSTS